MFGKKEFVLPYLNSEVKWPHLYFKNMSFLGLLMKG
jgi:hypothetical protein